MVWVPFPGDFFGFVGPVGRVLLGGLSFEVSGVCVSPRAKLAKNGNEMSNPTCVALEEVAVSEVPKGTD